MGQIITNPCALSIKEVTATIAFDQPHLRAEQNGSHITVSGSYLLFEKPGAFNPGGPITTFDIKVVVGPGFPQREPKVLETAGRIPRENDRHINGDGTCCLTVWEHWLLTAPDRSFAGFFNGPLHQFFLGQYWYEQRKEWPFGERPHGLKGLLEAYADILGVPNKKTNVLYRLRLLAKDWPKGHWLCPCGSGNKLRHCHRSELMELHARVPPSMARRMQRRLKSQAGQEPL